eukprot:CAMPEP_0178539730 /NCGR_PEP_ID=MMETSP0697-20121206/656_1 /TAXON_ID=265572 /ORGANISM="Extubocellulus spinifer, Strain CCMP396" /LENGTH=339 /DNA_ID=CAMNT_0020172033 /DNA_START=62 /DNA_END=1081 /DNA_ORIENTATION=-
MTTSSSSSRRTVMLPQPPPLLATLLLLLLLLLLSASSVDAFPPPPSRVGRPGAAAATSSGSRSPAPVHLLPSSTRTRIVGGPSAPSASSAASLAAASSFIHLRNPATGRLTTYSLHASYSSSDELPPKSGSQKQTDNLIIDTAYTMRRLSWFSWWAQVILTTISSVILLFARSIGAAAAAESNGGSAMIKGTAPPAGFLLGGIGIVLSVASIFWTWGKARLSNRLLGGRTSRIQGANLLRRAITVGSALNLAGMLATLLGTFVIIGGLATKVLTAGLGGGGAVVMGGGPNAVALQTVQPLDILIIQANANTLLSHFVSLFLTLFLTRFVMRMDPPSTED